MTSETGSVRLIKEERKGISQALKPSEIKALFALAIVGISVLAFYFLLLPMLSSISELEAGIVTLQAQKDEYHLQIAKTEQFKDTYEEALSDYTQYSEYFFEPMDPETIDERITSMMMAYELTPATLTMTTLRVEGISGYTAEELRANPAPDAEDEGEGEGIEDPEEDEAPVEDSVAIESDIYAFAYTVNVFAYGERDSLYDFLAHVAKMTAMEVTSFSFTDAETTKAAPGEKNTQKPATIDIELKLYVFVDGAPARDHTDKI